MNGHCKSEPITSRIQAANEAWQFARLPASTFEGDRRVTVENQPWYGNIEYLRAEIRHLKDELQRTAQERDMLRNANRIIAVTIQAQQDRRSTTDKKHPLAARNRGRPVRPR